MNPINRLLTTIGRNLKSFLSNPNPKRRKPMTSEEILKGITSRDASKVWRSSCEIASISQDRQRIIPLIRYLPEIQSKTVGLEMGGAFAPNKRFVDFAIRTLQFHRDSRECPCCLYTHLDSFNPPEEEHKGNIKILYTIREQSGYVDYYKVRCCKCGQPYKVIERDYHYTWWGWTKSVPDPWTFDEHKDFPSPDKSHRLVYENLSEVAMGAPSLGAGYIETGSKQRIKIHDSCGGPPLWEITGKMVALPIWTIDRGQRLGVVDLAKMELTIFQEKFGVLHIRSFDKNLIDTRSSKLFDINKKRIETVMSLV
jgi:hypothetical protein